MNLREVICPKCQSDLKLTNNNKSAICSQGHLYDFAKQGYLNLLLAENKKSKHPGDDSEMVTARSRFLDTGKYQGISDFLNEIIKSTIISMSGVDEPNKPSSTFNYTDLACGEGYYTQRVSSLLNGHVPDSCVTGIDISTPAIKSACRRDRSLRWLVGSANATPLKANSQDIISGLFFHFNLNEVARLLKPKGTFIMITTGPQHLLELRERVYDQIKEPKKSKAPDESVDSLQFKEMITYTSNIELNNRSQIENLFRMTPHYWRAAPDKKASLLSLDKLRLTIDIQADIFTRP